MAIAKMLRMSQARNKPEDPSSHLGLDPTADSTVTDKVPPNASEVKDRFWNETSTPSILPAPPPIQSSKKATTSPWHSGKPSIAAATIIGILTFAAICFLSFYYIRRERRARRLRQMEMQNQSQDPFGRSSLSLTAETSKTLDDFLMKDVPPPRTSLMFSRSRSPSVTFVVGETDRARRSNRNSYDASSATSLHKLEVVERVSNDKVRWSPRGSEHSSSSVTRETPSIVQPMGLVSPRMSMCSTMPSMTGLSQLWVGPTSDTTASASTEESSLFSQEPDSSKSSQSIPRSLNSVGASSRPSSGTGASLVQSSSNASRSSHASSRPSVHSVPRTDPRAIKDVGSIRRSHARSRSHSLSQSNITPIAESESSDTSSALGSSQAVAVYSVDAVAFLSILRGLRSGNRDLAGIFRLLTHFGY